MNINKKTLLIAVLILSLCLSLCACGNSAAAGAKAQDIKTEETESLPETALDESDPIYEEIADEIPSIEAFLEYLHINADMLDMTNLATDDYWNIVAVTLGAGAPGKDNLNRYGEISVKYSLAEEYAKTFMYDFWFRSGAPDYKKSYAVSANPGSGVLDFTPLTVDNYEGRVDYISAYSNGKWMLHYTLLNHVPEGESIAYDVLFERWDDGKEHVFPFRVVDTYYLGVINPPQNPS